MEEEVFLAIRDEFIANHSDVRKGNMMRSPAISVDDKVFAFFSRSKKMVFKLGDDYQPESGGIRPFNPFKNKGPLRGWFEVDYEEHTKWRALSEQALKEVMQ